jgi:hypothetical protein
MNSAQARKQRRALRRLEFEVLVDAHSQGEARQWCEHHFGKRWEVTGNREGMWCMFWAGREAFDKYRFCFAEEKQRNWFILRWAS